MAILEVNMDKNKAQEVGRIMNGINRCENFLSSLKRSYNDEFAIMYRGYETCELEEDVLQMIIEHYENKLKSLNEELKNYKKEKRRLKLWNLQK